MSGFIYLAIDQSEQSAVLDQAENLAKNVPSSGYGFKINLDAVLNFWTSSKSPREFILELSKLGKPIFVDIKIWNGERTMSNIAAGLADLNVDIINVYPHSGRKFVKKMKESIAGSKTKLFGLTVLTHYTEEYTREIYGLSFSDTVRKLAQIDLECGVDGIILPPTELKTVRDINLLKLCPGIRPDWFIEKKTNNQEQTATPRDAILAGASHLVIGSPVFKSENPVEALKKVLNEIGHSLK